MATITEQQKKNWKKAHGDLFEISVGDKTGYFRKPDRNALSLAFSKPNDPFHVNETIAKNCWIGGDKALIEDDDLFLAIMPKLSELIVVKEAQIKKI